MSVDREDKGGWPGRFHRASLNAAEQDTRDTDRLDDWQTPGDHPMVGFESFVVDDVYHIHPEDADAAEIAAGHYIQIDESQAVNLGDMR